MCKSKRLGGMGVRSIRHKNMALLSKWQWRYGVEKNGFWRRFICKLYKYNDKSLLPGKVPPNCKVVIWKQIMEVNSGSSMRFDVIKLGLGVLLGNGENILFWEDQWAGDRCFKKYFPRLFTLCENKKGLVYEFGECVNDRWQWKLKFRRRLFQWEIELEAELMRILSHMSPSINREDRVVWKPVTTVKFSTASYVQSIENLVWGDALDLASRVWRGLAPPKVEVFCWFAVNEKLPTMDFLSSRNCWSAQASNLCKFCERTTKTVNRIFLHCEWAQSYVEHGSKSR